VPELSVVIPTFNTASMTLRCCRAVLATMPEGCEVIAADDGSSDGTAELLAREVPSVQVVRLESNRGFAPAANCGVGVARGRIILLLNSDAMVLADALRALVAAFDDPSLGIAGARLVNEDGTPQWSGGPTPTLPWMIGVVSGLGRFARLFRRKSKHRQECLCHIDSAGEHNSIGSEDPMWHRHSCLCEVDWVSGAAMAFRREVWNAAGPLEERFRFYCQDIEFCLRAREAGWRVAIVENARVAHAIGGTVAADSTLHHDPARLWPDLFTWGGRRYGCVWMFFARIVLTLIAVFRIAARAIRRRDNTAFIRAVKAIRRI